MRADHIRKYIPYLTIAAGIICALFYKCRYGYAVLDEAFYPTIGYRFSQGDAVLYEEWSNTQLYGVLMVPIIRAYIFVNGSTEGIYLFFRYLYTLIKIIFSIFVYFRLQRYGKKVAYTATLLFLIFTPYGLMVLSYNTIAFGGTAATLLLLLNETDRMRSKICCVLAGVTLSVSVLGIPYMAFLYPAYFVAVLCMRIWGKGKIQNGTIRFVYSFRAFGMLSIGVWASAGAYLLYVFSHTSLRQIWQTLPHILYGDPAHPGKGLYRSTLAYLVKILVAEGHNYVVFAGYVLIGIVLLLYLMDKKREMRKGIYLMASGISVIVLLMIYMTTVDYINSIVFVPNILAFILMVMVRDPRINALFGCIWIPGMLVTYLEYLASNTGFYGISAASCVAATGSMMMIGIAISMNWKGDKTVSGILLLFVTLTLCGCMYYRITYVFWEDGIPTLTQEITFGTAKGLMVTEEEKEHYEIIYRDTEQIRQMDKETKVLYIGDQTLWMAGMQRCASYSPLCYSISSDRSILYHYYEEHPDMVADAVYIEYSYGIEMVEELAGRLGFHYQAKEAGWVLLP